MMAPQSREHAVSALLIGEYEKDRSMVQQVFEKSGWRLFEARDRRLAMQYLERNPVHVVIVETNVPDWDWKHVLNDLRGMPEPPQLIVTSLHADDRLWAEALNVGAFDVLPQPIAPDEAERVIAAARRHFNVKPVRAGRNVLSAAGAA